MRFCPHCGAAVDAITKFCSDCGASFTDGTVAAAPAATSSKICYACKSEVHPDATKCPHCSEDLSPVVNGLKVVAVVLQMVGLVWLAFVLMRWR